MAYATDDHEALWAQLATRKPHRPLSAYDAPVPPPHPHSRGRIQSGRFYDGPDDSCSSTTRQRPQSACTSRTFPAGILSLERMPSSRGPAVSSPRGHASAASTPGRRPESARAALGGGSSAQGGGSSALGGGSSAADFRRAPSARRPMSARPRAPSTTLWSSDRSVACSMFTELPSAAAAARYGKPDAWKDDRMILAWYEEVKARKKRYKAFADETERKDTARISTIIDKQHKKEAARKDSGRDLTSMAAANRGNFNALSSKFKAAGKLIQLKFISETNLKVAGGGLTSTAGASHSKPTDAPAPKAPKAAAQAHPNPNNLPPPSDEAPPPPAARQRPRTAPARRRTSPQKTRKAEAGRQKGGQWAVGHDRQTSTWSKVLTWQPITVKRRDPTKDPRHRDESVWVNPGVYKTLTIES